MILKVALVCQIEVQGTHSFTTDELTEHDETQEGKKEHGGLSTESQPETKGQVPDETDYGRLDSYQAFLVYPVKEFDTNTSWHSSLSVSLGHPVFITVSV